MLATVGPKPVKLPVSSSRRPTSTLSTTEVSGSVIDTGKACDPPVHTLDEDATEIDSGVITGCAAVGLASTTTNATPSGATNQRPRPRRARAPCNDVVIVYPQPWAMTAPAAPIRSVGA
jgi:hypothetical protein